MSSFSIFVPRDFMLDALLDRLALTLAGQGHRVVRGQPVVPGKVQMMDLRSSDAAAVAQADVAVLTGRTPVSQQGLAACERLRGIVAPSIGVDFIDLNMASRLGVLVANGATVECVVSTAEATVMLVLMLLYRPDWSQQVLQGTRARPLPSPEARWARTLYGKKVGLVGYGNIASRVAERLQSFGARVVVADYVRLNRGGVPTFVSVQPLDALLASCDIVSLHAKAVPDQAPLIGSRELSLMRPEAYLVNTARGALVDQTALYEALSARKIAGAALDTFEVEPLPDDSPLRSLDNVLLTPHMVGATRELYESMYEAALDNVGSLLAGRVPPFCLNHGIASDWLRRWGH
jgi:D-3-phosphoglycerate dehydrogenase